jgi:thioredoxin-like negative regulator of GroEL
MPDPTTIDIACLCAAWCRVCDSYRPVLEQVTDELAADLAASGACLRRHWIDIEDEAHLLGDLDIETFPTVVVLDAASVRFAGTLTPQRETLRRILRATVTEAAVDSRGPAVSDEFIGFAQRLRARLVGRG